MRATFDLDQPARIAECALDECAAGDAQVPPQRTRAGYGSQATRALDRTMWRELNRDGFTKIDDWEVVVPTLNMTAVRSEATQIVSAS